jgi:hypothetical protein
MTRKTQEKPIELPVWPAKKPIPSFRTLSEEDRFWQSYEFEDDLQDEGWEELIGPKPPKSPIARKKRPA